MKRVSAIIFSIVLLSPSAIEHLFIVYSGENYHRRSTVILCPTHAPHPTESNRTLSIPGEFERACNLQHF
jgi:hypothetical protein